ncbi:MAG: isoleucine--tRNA ligase [Candidatus Dependentiae bacterium]|nr:isoleucine--tRNA ligase [Candidatus Dependentiae bacterium]
MAENMPHSPEKSPAGVSFKDTLNLPRTDFPMRANPKIDDPLMLERWQKEDLYTKTFELNKGARTFILHDGPPYANGHLHLGHAYNVILKDIVTKSQRMMGKHVPVTPGWDCHGLPIELQVTKANPDLEGANLKAACRAHAQQWVDIQKQERKNLGVLMDFERPYLTMDFDYEAHILRAFGSFVGDGYIERKNKTVPWCASCQTVLATAEIEYQERKDPSVYVLFTLTQETVNNAFPAFEGRQVSLLVWTTTPWTLPLNRAVLLRPQATYTILDIAGAYVVVGKQLADKVCALMGVEKKIISEFVADNLVAAHARAQHPFIDTLTIPLLLDESVLLEDGTAFVHCAPGAGPEDYLVGVKNNLAIYSPVGPNGTYTSDVLPVELAGMSVADGQIWVIKKLAEKNKLLFKATIRHPYPHCWRCHNGLIFRATKQWFCDLSKNNLKERALEAADTIKTIPEKSIARLKATLDGRLEWCLSRQRTWGVPIPALICTTCDHTYINQDLVSAVADGVAKHGVEFWDRVPVERLLASDFTCPPGVEFWEPLVAEIEVIKNEFTCPHCKGTSFIKEKDILDVWFDSGVSHYAVLQAREELQFPADMYLEGKDQHRGWFQSSLLTSMVLHGQPSMKTLLTHGYTVDAQGRKMSKSLGNVIAPQEIIDKIGIDGLHLWVSSIDCAGEVVISPALLQNVQEVFRKIRNTCRFLVSTLYDFDIEHNAVDFEHLRLMDQYALQELFQLNHRIISLYKAYDFTAIFHALGDYCSVNLSAFYLDVAKDRLYVAAADSKDRRSAQTACWYILDTVVKLMAPILSFTAEQLSDHYQKSKTESIHVQQFNSLKTVWESLTKDITMQRIGMDGLLAQGGDIESLGAIDKIVFEAEHQARWALLHSIRSAILKALEIQRELGVIKHPLEAHVTAYFDDNASGAATMHAFFAELQKGGQTPELFFKELVIVSCFDIVTKPDGLMLTAQEGFYVSVTRAAGDKCPRCWQWHTDQHEHSLCGRCYDIVTKLTL